MWILHLIVRFIINGIAVYVAAQILPGVSVDSFTTAMVAGLVLALIHHFVSPILNLLTLPINLMTLGIFGAILNALLIMSVQYFVPGFFVASLLWALIFSVVVSLINAFFSLLAV